MSEENYKFKRKLKNIIINPSFQIRLALRFIIAYVVIAGLIQAFFTFLLESYLDQFIKIFPITTDQHILLHDIVVQSIIFMSLMTALGAITIFFLAVYHSHKIAGPIYVLKNSLDKLADGDLNVRTKFRDGDEFSELSEPLTRLVERLKKQNN